MFASVSPFGKRKKRESKVIFIFVRRIQHPSLGLPKRMRVDVVLPVRASFLRAAVSVCCRSAQVQTLQGLQAVIAGTNLCRFLLILLSVKCVMDGHYENGSTSYARRHSRLRLLVWSTPTYVGLVVSTSARLAKVCASLECS